MFLSCAARHGLPAALVRHRAGQVEMFGVPAGLVATIVVSLLDLAPDAYTKALVDYIRHP